MIAKVIAHGATRDEARERLARALDGTVALGVATNKAFLAAVLRDEEFARGADHAHFLDRRSRSRSPRSRMPRRSRSRRRCLPHTAASASGTPGATTRRA